MLAQTETLTASSRLRTHKNLAITAKFPVKLSVKVVPETLENREIEDPNLDAAGKVKLTSMIYLKRQRHKT